MDLNSVRRIASEHGYSSFTKLQDRAFSAPEAYDNDRDLFIIGETSSGKTLIPLLLYAAALKDAAAEGHAIPKMLFVVPYRALAAQKQKELRDFFESKEIEIIQSTGEYRQDDDAVQKGDVHIAIVITEKVYKYAARDSSFLSKYDYLVLDEIGLVDNADRGVRLDFLFAWAHSGRQSTGRPRTVALGTPCYDWGAYIDTYGFYAVREDGRPVTLDEVTVITHKQYINRVEGQCDFLHPMRMITHKEARRMRDKYPDPAIPCQLMEHFCLLDEPARIDCTKPCPVSGEPCSVPFEYISDDSPRGVKYILSKICRTHLLAGHQILVFVNDRERVKEYCKCLYRELADLLPEAPDAEECRREILEYCELDSDDVFGILEEGDGSAMELEFYRAFKSGVAFHSAALPNELRTYVEDKLLGSREMKIVCSTETLAFGVNSSVDAVVISELSKKDGSSDRQLTLNEYRNYAGRAGRLRRDTQASDINGYVYTLIGMGEVDYWESLKESALRPERLYSRFHDDDGRKMSFFLMNLIPTDISDGMSVAQMTDAVLSLPQDGSHTADEIRTKIRDSIRFLLDESLIAPVRVRPTGRGEAPRATAYCLTELGKRLRGYIIGAEDYIQLLSALEEYVDGIFSEPDRVTFLFHLLQTKHAENGLSGCYKNNQRTVSELREYIRSCDGGEHDLEWLDECDDRRILSILAALLAWCDGESARFLNRQFGVHYALVAKLAEQIAYLIEICAAVLPTQMERIWEAKQEQYQLWMKVDIDDFLKQESIRLSNIRDLFTSVYFGVNTVIAYQLLEYLDPEDADPSQKDPAAVALAEHLALNRINPQTARLYRRVAVRYKFFDSPPEYDPESVISRNNFQSQRRQYKKDIEGMSRYILSFFKTVFGEKYTD